jgi:hypothetical protein
MLEDIFYTETTTVRAVVVSWRKKVEECNLRAKQ